LLSPVQAQSSLETYRQTTVLGYGTLLEAQWATNESGLLINSTLGAWLYNSDFTLLHHFEGVSHATLRPSGQFLATAKADPGQLLIWDTATYALLKTIDIQIKPLWPWIDSLTWSPDGSQLAMGVDQQLQIFDISSDQNNLSLTFASPILYLSWRQDGEQLAVSRFNAIDIVNTKQGVLVNTLDIESPWPMALWSPDQQTFATLSRFIQGPVDNALRLWSPDGGTLKLVIQAPLATTFAWSPDSQSIVAEHKNFFEDDTHKLYFWDARTGERDTSVPELIAGLPYTRSFLSVAWSPDGTKLMTASHDNVVRISDWPLHYEDTPLELFGYQGPITDLAWNANGTQLASSSEDSSIRIWNITTGEPIKRLQSAQNMAQSVSWNKQTDQIVFGTESPYLYEWDPLTEAIRNSNGLHRQDIDSEVSAGVPLVAYSPDGKMIASGGGDNTVIVWQAEDLTSITTTDYTSIPLSSLAWSGDSRLIAYNGGPAHVLNVATNIVENFECGRFGVTDVIASVSLSPNGQYLIAANQGNGICVWDIKSKELLGRLQLQDEADIQGTALAWSLDGSRLALISPRPSFEAVAENRKWVVEVWSVPTRERLSAIESLTRPTDIAWLPDGTRLAVGDSAGLIHIWQRE